MTQQVELGGRGRVRETFHDSLTAFQTDRPWEFVEPLGSSWAGRGAWVQRGRQRHAGVEGGIEWTFEPNAKLEGRFSYIDAAGRGSELVGWDGRPLQNIPKAALYVSWLQRLQAVPGLSYSAALTARSSKPATADGSVRVGGYAVADLGLTWRPPSAGPRITLDLAVRNLADRRYWRDAGQAYSADLLFPGAARSVSIALRLEGFE